MFKSMIASIVSKNMKKKLENSTIKEEDLVEVLKQIRISLLDADVNLSVTKNLIKNIREAAVGTMVDPGQKPEDALLLIIKEELIKVLGSETKTIDFEKKKLKIMMVGLQGSGKTTTAAKIASFAKGKFDKKPLLVACDIYRPAAIDQLRTLSEEIKVDFYDKKQQDPVKTSKEALDIADKNKNDLVVIDTAGRLHTNKELMEELQKIKKATNPDEILLVVDAMAGQDITNVAQEFHNNLNLTGIVITKLDSDARAGAALSLRSILDVPIKLTGVGEKVGSLDVFHPERIVDKILGFGDMITLAEQAAENLDEKVVKRSFQKMLSGKMDLEDLMNQMEQLSKMGSIGSIMNMLPNSPKITEDKINDIEQKMKVWKVLLSSMTLKERRNPSLLKKNPNRRIRIIKGSGRKADELNKMLSEWEKAKERMETIGKQIKKGQNPFSSWMK
ncbi:signal recognition particle protein [Malacoplasma penetrans]|uniref:signal-recognition-particle GTPase n=1 Tax=Malacoplasma penetrans (strain HF-2) TaxID=272633 RepID=Q8EWF3_MALP2|nr:signal recognition particle protein [Malacoplasma penetrans]RXY96689.1 signal recognition particle protein [Malacoplasma penetrans]BAC44043.1 signal recognition particle GTPase [Malacoplasma penetrans HF-2]